MLRAAERRSVSSRGFHAATFAFCAIYGSDCGIISRARVSAGVFAETRTSRVSPIMRVREIGSSCHRSSSLPLTYSLHSMRERNENSRITAGALLFRSAAAEAPTNSRRNRVNKRAHSICRRAVLNGARKLAIAIIFKRAPT